VFRLGQQRPMSPSSAYSTAALVLSLAVVVRAAGQAGTKNEDEAFAQEISALFHLSEAESLRLRARGRWLSATGANLHSVRKPLSVLPLEMRETIGVLLVKFAHATGQISPPQIDLLLQVYRLLRLNPEEFFSAAHARATKSAPLDYTQSLQSHATVPNASPRTVSSDTTLDWDKVRLMAVESDRVSVLLREVFAEQDQPGASEAIAKQNAFGLDQPHARFLERILSKESWSRADLALLAAECHVLIEGAIDTLNDLALDRYGDLLLEGEDVMHLNPMITKELSNE
jgi:TerB-C domain